MYCSRGHFLTRARRFLHHARELHRPVRAHLVLVIGGSTDICLIRVTIDIAVIVLMISLPGWSSGAYILFVANFITILGIVFATVWTTNLNWIMRRMVEAGIRSTYTIIHALSSQISRGRVVSVRPIQFSGLLFSHTMIPLDRISIPSKICPCAKRRAEKGILAPGGDHLYGPH